MSLVKRIVPRTQCFFGVLGANESQTLVLAEHVDTHCSLRLEMVFRLHGSTSIGTGAQLVFTVLADGYDFDDPSTAFATPLASFTLTSSATFPLLQIVPSDSFGGGFGRYVMVQVAATQPASPVSLEADVSVDMILRKAEVDPVRELLPNVARGHVLQ